MAETLKDWQALDARIAREAMGWVKWDELSAVNRQLIAIYNRRTWLTLDELDCPHSTDLLYKDWQPHKDVAQAMDVLDAVVKNRFKVELRSDHYSPEHQVWIMSSDSSRAAWMGRHTVWASAICLAVEVWLGAQCCATGKTDRRTT